MTTTDPLQNDEITKRKNRNRTIANLKFPTQDLLETFWKKRYDKKFHTDILGKLDDKDKTYEKIRGNISKWYELHDEILKKLFHNRQSDQTIETVYLRVKLINEFYSTFVPEICLYNVACAIAKNKDLHQKIMKPKTNEDKAIAVHTISNLLFDDIFFKRNTSLKKSIYSFATKYCHFCNPQAFSIYDKYVAEFLTDYIYYYLKEKKDNNLINLINELNGNGNGNENKKELTYKALGKDEDKSVIDIKACINIKSPEGSEDLDKVTEKNIKNALKNYEYFISLVDAFTACCNLNKTYKDKRAKIDNFLWLGGMMLYKKESTVAELYQFKKKKSNTAKENEQ